MNNFENPENIPVRHRTFLLTNSSNPEDYGYHKEQIHDMLDILKENAHHPAFDDPEYTNEIGCFFEGGVCIEKDIYRAVYWYERSASLGNDLAKSNLADILRKGSQGYPKDLKRAFELYKSCRLPYTFYRVGEFLEHGWACDKDLELAKRYYRIAYKENHPLAKRKLQEFDFLH